MKKKKNLVSYTFYEEYLNTGIEEMVQQLTLDTLAEVLGSIANTIWCLTVIPVILYCILISWAPGIHVVHALI